MLSDPFPDCLIDHLSVDNPKDPDLGFSDLKNYSVISYPELPVSFEGFS